MHFVKAHRNRFKVSSIISKNLVETFNLVNFAATGPSKKTSTFSNHLQNDIKQPVKIITTENLNKSLNNPSIYSLFGLIIKLSNCVQCTKLVF